MTDIEVEDISYYYDEMLRSGLTELEIETPQGKIVLKRSQFEKEAPAAHAQAPASHHAPRKHETKAAPQEQGKAINSPITGILYRASSPQSAPFVKEGDTVEAGATLCIVEAMKVMNEIKAEFRCRILKIAAENGKPVAHGQKLFNVEPL